MPLFNVIPQRRVGIFTKKKVLGARKRFAEGLFLELNRISPLCYEMTGSLTSAAFPNQIPPKSNTTYMVSGYPCKHYHLFHVIPQRRVGIFTKKKVLGARKTISRGFVFGAEPDFSVVLQINP